ncbi:hypothetical protein WDU94_001711 [Cyamophila willieti]
MADKTYHASVGFVQDNSDDFGDWPDEEDGGDSGSLFDSNRSQGQSQGQDSSSSEQDDWLHLSPFKRLEKICNDTDIYKSSTSSTGPANGASIFNPRVFRLSVRFSYPPGPCRLAVYQSGNATAVIVSSTRCCLSRRRARLL